MSAKYKSPSFLLPNELNTSANTANDTGINSLYSMDFDGSSRIDAGSASYLNSLSQFSISVWFNLTTAASNKCIVSDWNYNTSPKGHFALQTYNASGSNYGLLLFIKATSDVGVNSVQTSAVLTENTWHHAVFTYNSGTVTCYVDGSSVSLTTIGTIPTTLTSQDGNLLIGDFAGLSRYWNGQIDEVAIFNRALDSTEIAALYDGTGSNIRPSNLMATNLNPIAYYPLGEQAQNSGYPSATGNEWQFPNGVLQDYVMDFDGVDDLINLDNGVSLNSSGYSLSIWFNSNSFSSIQVLFTNAASNIKFVSIHNSTTIRVRDGVNQREFTVPSLNAGLWYNLITVVDNGNCQVYLNSDVSSSPAQTVNQNWSIDAINGYSNFYGGSANFNGKLSNAQIFNSALPETGSNSVETLYNNGSPLTSMSGFTSLTNWWKLNADSVYTPSVSKYPTALNFASSSYIISSSSVITGNSDRTVSVWAKTPNYVSKKAIFSLGDTTGSGSTTKFAIRINGTDDIQIASKGYDFLFSNTGIIVTDNNWHHFAATYSYSGSTAYFKLYIDGNYIGEQTGSLQLNTSAGFSIATWGYGINRDFFNGDISNAVVYNSELTASQISTLFNFGTPETTPSFDPVAWWKLDDQTAITDSSGNGHTGTNNGATNAPGGVAYVPSWKITSALPIPTVNYTTALDFDGNNDLVNANSVVSSISSSTTGTVSGWIKYTTGGSAAYMITFTSNTNTSQQYLTFQGNSNGVAFAQIKNKWILQTNSAVFTSGNWYHYAVTQNETEPKIYINGTEYSNGNGAALTTYVGTDGTEWWPNLIDFNTVTIGGMIWNSGGTVYTNYGDQDLSNISIYNSALSSSQVSTLFNSGQPEAAISFSPVSWWKLDTGGSTITDYGSGGNNGTNNGATQVTSDVLISGFNIPVNGVSTTLPSTALQQSDLQFDSPYSNYSLSFDGSSYIDIGNPTELQLTNDISVSGWFKTSSSSVMNIFTKRASGINNWAVYMQSGKIYFWVSVDGSSVPIQIQSASTLNDGNWHFFTGIREGTTLKLYIDNLTAVSGTIASGSLLNPNGTVMIGKAAVNNFLWSGNIDEVATWNTALTDAQILEIYNNGRPKDLSTFSGTAPISWWRLGENAYFDNNSFTAPNSIAGAPNGIGSGTVTSMLSADAPGTYANGIGDGLAITDRVGDAALSVANSQSYNMIPDDKVPYVPGYIGAQISNTYSMAFDGTNYFDIGTGLKSTFDGATAFTISAWFKYDTANPNYSTIIQQEYTVAGDNYLATVRLSNTSTPQISNRNVTLTDTTALNSGQWYHIVSVFDGSSQTLTMFIDGTQVAQNTSAGSSMLTSASGSKCIIGANANNNRFLDGLIEEVAIFDKALTADQIKFDLYEPTALVGGVEKTADIENNTNLPTPVAWYRMGD